MGQHMSCCYKAPESQEELMYSAVVSDSPAALFYQKNHTKLLPEVKNLYTSFLRKNSYAINKFELKDTQLSDLDSQSLSKMIPELKNLSELKLINNNLGLTGMNHLTDHTSTMVNLEVLVISSNKINDQCMELICPTLPFVSKLRVVNFSYNEIQDKGVELFSSQLEYLRSLEEVDFSFNQATAASLMTLANQLKSIEDFCRFRVEGNKISEKELRKIKALFPDDEEEEFSGK